LPASKPLPVVWIVAKSEQLDDETLADRGPQNDFPRSL
jgi:hypothetical protein